MSLSRVGVEFQELGFVLRGIGPGLDQVRYGWDGLDPFR